MIIEDYVSFEVAKLLKEKGFYSPYCYSYYFPELKPKTPCISNRVIPIDTDKYLAPTLQMAMKWLRETHNIFIQVDYIWSPKELYTYTFDIHNMKSARSIFSNPYGESFDSYEEACEAAIKYCLTNLI